MKKGCKVLNLKELDRETLSHAFGIIEKYKKGLNREQVQKIYDEGVPIRFSGNAPFAENLDYFLFYRGANNGASMGLKVECYFSKSDHPAIMGNDPNNAVVGGTLTKNRFTGFSSTWLKKAMYRSPAYDFGEAINDIMLEHFNIPK